MCKEICIHLGNQFPIQYKYLLIESNLITSQKRVTDRPPPNDTSIMWRGVWTSPAITGQIVGTEGPVNLQLTQARAESLLGSILL